MMKSIDFFKAVSDASDGVPLVHYNTVRNGRLLTEGDYERILRTVPTLIGTKTASSNVDGIVRLLQADLPMNHFIRSEKDLVQMAMWGSKGVYSAFALCWPEACVRLFELCRHGQWTSALALQERFNRFYLEGLVPLEARGFSDATWDKGKAEAAGLLRSRRYVRAPHHAMTQADIDHLRKVGGECFSGWTADTE